MLNINTTRQTAVFLLTIAFFLGATVSAFASNLTVVRGNAYDESNGGKGIPNLTVTVICKSDKKDLVRTATTDSFGLYTVHYRAKRCDTFDPVTSTATYKGQTLSET